MPILEINNLSKNYGNVRALDNLNLRIEKGNVYGILGPNGSGKTTTLGIILGILKQSNGSYQWFDGKLGEKSRMKIGAILETPNFYPYLNAEKNLDIIRHIKGVSEQSFDELLDLVDLSKRKKSNFNTYSLGMKQRLAIAATMIGDPEVVIFDEPTNGLDPQGIAEVRNILGRVADSGKTVIMASHILNEVEKICSHVAIIKYGKLLATGSVGSILSNDLIMEIGSDELDRLREFLNSIPWIKKIDSKKGFLECNIEAGHKAAEMNKIAFDQGITLTHLVARKKNLEQEFMEITNKTN